ncbi:MAG: hypothetical protein ACKOD2_06550 [Ilumatobacteraceae bacterium]
MATVATLGALVLVPSPPAALATDVAPALTDTTTIQTPNAYPYVIRFKSNVWIYELAPSDFTNTGTASGCTFFPWFDFFAGERVVEVTCTSPGTVAVKLAQNSVTNESGTRGPTQEQFFRSGTTSNLLTLTETTPPQATPVYPYFIKVTTNRDIKNLSSSTITIPETILGCHATPDRTSAKSGDSVTFRVDCFNTGTINPYIAANAVALASTGTGPAANMQLGSHRFIRVSPVITNTTPATTTQSPLIIRFSSSVGYSYLDGSDFSYTGTATGCVFTPSSDRAERGVSNIVVVR